MVPCGLDVNQEPADDPPAGARPDTFAWATLYVETRQADNVYMPASAAERELTEVWE